MGITGKASQEKFLTGTGLPVKELFQTDVIVLRQFNVFMRE